MIEINGRWTTVRWSLICINFILLSSIVGCCSAPFKDWSKMDSSRQILYSTVLAVDWLQTRQGICGSDQFEERHPLLGKKPSKTDIDLYMGATLLYQIFVASMIDPEYRGFYQSALIGFESCVIYNNYKLGVRINF
jgi:hypothetical protein